METLIRGNLPAFKVDPMIGAIRTGANAALAHSTSINTTANNLANVNTTGFKRSQVQLQDVAPRTGQAPGTLGAGGAQLPGGVQVGGGTSVGGISQNFSQGPLQHTGNPLDIAIEGDGFLRVLLPSGEAAFTRDGALHRSADGQLVTSDGFPIQPPVAIPADATSIAIGSDGTVSVTTGDGQNAVVGNITLADFANPGGLLAVGRNLFRETAASGAPVVGIPGEGGLGTIQQGFLEQSNVEVVSELTNLIVSQRAFEVSTRVIRVGDELFETANNLIQ